MVRNGLGTALRPLLPAGTSLPALLAIAALAAVLANVCNNLPAVLVLLPLTAPAGAGAAPPGSSWTMPRVRCCSSGRRQHRTSA